MRTFNHFTLSPQNNREKRNLESEKILVLELPSSILLTLVIIPQPPEFPILGTQYWHIGFSSSLCPFKLCHYQHFQRGLVSWFVGCRFKANCPLVGPGPFGGVPSVGGGVFLRDPSPYLREFRRKPRKTPNG